MAMAKYRAKERCYIGDIERQEGDEFVHDFGKHGPPKHVEEVKDEKPPKE